MSEKRDDLSSGFDDDEMPPDDGIPKEDMVKKASSGQVSFDTEPLDADALASCLTVYDMAAVKRAYESQKLYKEPMTADKLWIQKRKDKFKERTERVDPKRWRATLQHMMPMLGPLITGRVKSFQRAMAAIDGMQKTFHDPYPPRDMTEALDLTKPHAFKMKTELGWWLRFAYAAYDPDVLRCHNLDVQSETFERCYEEFTGNPRNAVVYRYKGSGINLPSHYVSLDHRKKAIVMTIRGTSSKMDALTDLSCRVDEKGFHEGMYLAAKNVDKRVRKLVLGYAKLYTNYRLVVTGHSLGAGTTALLAFLWLSDASFDLPQIPGWKSEDVKPGVPRITSFSYHSPPVVSLKDGKKFHKNIFTINHGRDIVSRMSWGSSFFLIHILKFLMDEKATEFEKMVDKTVGCEGVPVTSWSPTNGFKADSDISPASTAAGSPGGTTGEKLFTPEQLQTSQAKSDSKLLKRIEEMLEEMGAEGTSEERAAAIKSRLKVLYDVMRSEAYKKCEHFLIPAGRVFLFVPLKHLDEAGVVYEECSVSIGNQVVFDLTSDEALDHAAQMLTDENAVEDHYPRHMGRSLGFAEYEDGPEEEGEIVKSKLIRSAEAEEFLAKEPTEKPKKSCGCFG